MFCNKCGKEISYEAQFCTSCQEEQNTITQAEASKQEASTKFKPITCPKCNSTHLAIITEYHKSIACRIVEIVLIIVLIFVSFSYLGKLIALNFEQEQNTTISIELTEDLQKIENTASPPIHTTKDNEDSDIGTIIMLTLFIGFFKITRYFIESKTHVQCVCRDCGKTWLHKDEEIF